MAFLNENQLRRNFTKNFSGSAALNEQFGVKKSGNKIFLSYRHQDRDFVVPIVTFLLELGVNIYVDYLDSEPPNSPSSKTAPTLRARIEESKN